MKSKLPLLIIFIFAFGLCGCRVSIPQSNPDVQQAVLPEPENPCQKPVAIIPPAEVSEIKYQNLDVSGWQRLYDYSPIAQISMKIPKGWANVSPNDGSLIKDNYSVYGLTAKINKGMMDDNLYFNVDISTENDLSLVPGPDLLSKFVGFRLLLMCSKPASSLQVSRVKLGQKEFVKIYAASSDELAEKYYYFLYLPTYSSLVSISAKNDSEEIEKILATIEDVSPTTNMTAAEQASSCQKYWAGPNLPVYTDKVYGFSLKLPPVWKGKYWAKDRLEYGKRVSFYLPTDDPEWQAAEDVPIFDIVVWTEKEWEQTRQNCVKEPSPACVYEQDVIARIGDKVFSLFFRNGDYPKDQVKIAPCFDTEYLKDKISF